MINWLIRHQRQKHSEGLVSIQRGSDHIIDDQPSPLPHSPEEHVHLFTCSPPLKPGFKSCSMMCLLLWTPLCFFTAFYCLSLLLTVTVGLFVYKLTPAAVVSVLLTVTVVVVVVFVYKLTPAAGLTVGSQSQLYHLTHASPGLSQTRTVLIQMLRILNPDQIHWDQIQQVSSVSVGCS